MSKTSSKKFKEKVVQMYETLLQSRDSFVDSDKFWDEFFLLKANSNALENELNSIRNERFIELKPRFNCLSSQCLIAIKRENQIRAANALISLCTLAKCVSNRSRTLKIDFIDFIMGYDNIELKLNLFSDSLCDIIINDTPNRMKSLVLNFFLILITASDNINKNPIMEYLMHTDQLFDALFHLLNDSHQRHHYGYKTILLLTLLVNYRKYESSNPYVMKLSIVDDEVALSGYAQILSNSLIEFNKKFDSYNCEPKFGLFSTLTSIVGSMFVNDENCPEKNDLKINNAILLAFYDAVHLNRNFITLLTNSQTETFSSPQVTDETSVINEDAMEMIQNPPSNLLVAFIEFCSIIMLHTKEEANLETSRLCFVILTCISEDQCANAIMHDINMAFMVHLHRMPMRHRKITDSRTKVSRPLSYSVLDLMVEFILTHMRKTLLLDLYLLCFGVIHRILCYQKKCKIRVEYAWRDLWSALIALLKFIINNEAELLKKCNIFVLALQVVNIFNLFITFGDTFLPSPQTYDELYYEIIRMNAIFEHLYSMALRHVSNEGTQYKEFAAKLSNSLVNIKSIISHFNAKIESWSAVNQTLLLTEEQVLEIVRNNYDTLTLKLQDNLDQYDQYNTEKQKEAHFFANLLQNIVTDYRSNISLLSAKEQHILMQDLQLISNISTPNQEIVTD